MQGRRTQRRAASEARPTRRTAEPAGRGLTRQAVRIVLGAVLGMAVFAGGLFVEGGTGPAYWFGAALVVALFAGLYRRNAARSARLRRPLLATVVSGYVLAIGPVWPSVHALVESYHRAPISASVTDVRSSWHIGAPHHRYDVRLFDDARGRYLPRWLDGTADPPWRVGEGVSVYADPAGLLPPLEADDAHRNEWLLVLSPVGLLLLAACARPLARSMRTATLVT